ncbi:MAG: hypothetical protein NVSMB19_07730 [Vulcanimicrobiaceae bacterium]
MISKSSPTKSKSSKSFANSCKTRVYERAARFFARLVFCLALCVAGGFLAPAQAAAAPGFVDKRVTALPAVRLLHEPGERLVDSRRQHAARRVGEYDRPLFFLWAFSQIAAFFYLWASGLGARLRDAVRRAIRKPFAARAAYGAALVAIGAAASFPASLVRFRVAYDFGLTTERAGAWYLDALITTALDAVVVGAIVACVFWLVDRTRVWYLFTMAGLFVVTLVMAFVEPVVVSPLYNRVSPVPATAAVGEPIRALARRAGIGSAPIGVRNDSLRSDAVEAEVEGFGPTTRVILGDALLADATTGEVLVLAAREFGHYAHGDTFRLSLFWTTLFILCTAFAVVIADRMTFRRDDDPLARLSLVFAFMGLLGLAVTPIYNGYSRNLEARADAYALALTGDRASAVRAYVRIADETLAPLCPPPLVRAYFYNSPPLGTRIAKATGRPDPCR